MRLHSTLKNFRLSRKLTQKDLAGLLGITTNYVYMLETGRAWPSGKLLHKYSEVFHFNYRWIMAMLADSKVTEYRQHVYHKYRL